MDIQVLEKENNGVVCRYCNNEIAHNVIFVRSDWCSCYVPPGNRVLRTFVD